MYLQTNNSSFENQRFDIFIFRSNFPYAFTLHLKYIGLYFLCVIICNYYTIGLQPGLQCKRLFYLIIQYYYVIF